MGLIAPFFIWLIFINKHFSMSVILLNNDNFKKLLKEAPVSGDKAALTAAKAQGGLERAKDRLAKLSIVSIPGLESINTIDQLAIEPFKFTFLLQVKDDPQGLSLPIPHEFNTLARVIEKNPLTLEVKTDEGVLFKMVFTEENELITQLPGTKKPIVGKSNKVMALVSEEGNKKGKFYTIKFDNANAVVEEAKKEEGKEQEGEGIAGEKQEGEGTESGKNNKEQLFNDLTGFFKFTYNNRRLAAPELFPKEKPKNTLESFINQIAKNVILIKEDDDENDPTNIDSIGKIYVKSIELGPKAAARAGEERENYTKKVNATGGQTWNGNITNLPQAKGGQLPALVNVKSLTLDLVDNNLTPEQESVFKQIKGILGKSNFKGQTKIRRSAASPKDTIIIAIPTQSGEKAIICKILKNQLDLTKYIDVEVSPKVDKVLGTNDTFTKSTKAKLQIKL